MSQTVFHTAIALDHVVVLFASGGMVDLFLAAYQDTLVVSFAAAAVVAMVVVAAALQEVHHLVVHRSEEAVVLKGVHTDHAVAVVPLYFLEELLVHPDFLDY